MRKFFAGALASALLGFIIAPQTKVFSHKSSEPHPPYVSNQILVKLKADVEFDSINNEMSEFIARPHGANAEQLERANRGALYRIDLDGSLSVEESVERMASDPRVEYAEPNYLLYPAATPNDAFFGQQWSLMNDGAFGVGKVGADISATRAWDLTTGSSD